MIIIVIALNVNLPPSDLFSTQDLRSASQISTQTLRPAWHDVQEHTSRAA
jgi:hypothetical protein